MLNYHYKSSGENSVYYFANNYLFKIADGIRSKKIIFHFN